MRKEINLGIYNKISQNFFLFDSKIFSKNTNLMIIIQGTKGEGVG
jgi:hypothetical protein